MHSKIAIIVASLAAVAAGIWAIMYFTKSIGVANAATPGIGPGTPLNATPVNLGALPTVASPSAVVPSAVNAAGLTPAQQSAAGQLAGTAQGPSYSDFLSQQQLNSAGTDYSNLPLAGLTPSLMVVQTAVPDSVMPPAGGVEPPGISTDAGNYGGTGDAFYS